MKIIPETSRAFARILVLLGLLAFTPIVQTLATTLPVFRDIESQIEFTLWAFVANYLFLIPAIIMIIIGVINVRRHNLN
jgi:hypothetical protein